jgi:DNA excision repair protein ERCC-2
MSAFPYQPRSCQTKMMKVVEETIAEGGHAAIEAPTGTGKTVAVLAPIIESIANGSGKRFLYLTRTNAQQRQVILETRRIRDRLGSNIIVTGFQGRRNLCPMARENARMKNGSAEELSRYCIEMKRRPGARRCRYYRNLTGMRMDEQVAWYIKEIPTVEETYKRMKELAVCPYEFIKRFIERAQGITAPYLYLFEENIRNMLLDRMNVEMKDLVVVIDEAHNLPDFLRGLASCSYSVYAIGRAKGEANAYRDPMVAEGIRATRFFNALHASLADLASEYLKKGDESLIPAPSLREELMTNLGVASTTLDTIVASLIAIGEKIRVHRLANDELPRSFMGSAGMFLKNWENIDDERYVRVINSRRSPVISGCCLDASLMSGPLAQVHASIHMSGTLNPLDQYRDIIGLPKDRTRLASLPSPFPKENRKVVYSKDVTTRFEDMMANKQETERIWRMLRQICDSVSRNTVVFFPSYRLLSSFIGSKWGSGIEPKPYIEESEMRQDEVMEMVEVFKKRVGSPLMFSVIGGRISEGLDFPDRELDIVVIVGIPYPRPEPIQDALQRYYELRFGPGMGWEYAVRAPTTRRLLQCIGRLIRSESDRGIGIILDKRAVRFQSYIHDLRPSNDPVADIKTFFPD